jgi:uncharacterized repeat protein (TIGR03803 family)
MQSKTYLSILFFALFTTVTALAANETVLYSFKGGDDGRDPRGGLVSDKSGNLYGLTSKGGRGGVDVCFGTGCGFIYKLTKTSNGTWKKSNLYSFTGGSDGGVPVGKMVIDTQGNLYGVAEQGGTGGCDTVLGGGCGVVFQLSPKPKGHWKYSVIHDFDSSIFANDGAYSNAGVVFDGSGNLYGTTEFGGDFLCDCGIVYQLKPEQNGQWTENIHYTFIGISRGGTDVSFPTSGVFVDAGDRIFGTGSGGGDVNCNDGCGGVYELIPKQDGSYREVVLHIFTGNKDGIQPSGGVTVDAKGNVYGTTEFGGGAGCNNGGFGCGTVFQLTKLTKGYREKIILRFTGQNGYAPFADLYIDSRNNLYGTTDAGGNTNNGVVFRLTESSGKWQESVLHSFGQGKDGAIPEGGLISDGKSGYFGTTRSGGTAGRGVVFHLVP